MYHKPNTLIKCIWADAWSGNSWRTASEINHSPIQVTTVGFVVKHDNVGLSMAATVDHNGTYGGVCFRPAKMIVKTKVLERAVK